MGAFARGGRMTISEFLFYLFIAFFLVIAGVTAFCLMVKICMWILDKIL